MNGVLGLLFHCTSPEPLTVIMLREHLYEWRRRGTVGGWGHSTNPAKRERESGCCWKHVKARRYDSPLSAVPGTHKNLPKLEPCSRCCSEHQLYPLPNIGPASIVRVTPTRRKLSPFGRISLSYKCFGDLREDMKDSLAFFATAMKTFSFNFILSYSIPIV